LTKIQGLQLTKTDEISAIFEENGLTTSHKNNEKCAIFDEISWTTSNKNNEKCAIFDENA